MGSPLARLHEYLTDQLDSDEFRALCADLGISFFELAGETPGAKAQELLFYLGRRRQLERLFFLLNRSQPESFGATGLPTDPNAVEELYKAISAVEAELDLYLARAIGAYEAWAYQLANRAVSLPDEPFRFLQPYGLEDTGIFFGRAAALEEVHQAVLRSRLMVLHGTSGIGKTSLLNAALMPRLTREGRLPVYVRVHADPVNAIKQAIAPPASRPWPELMFRISLHELFSLVCAHLSRVTSEIVVILDQFEEYLAFWPALEHRRPFVSALADCCEDESLPLRTVLTVGDAFLPQLADLQIHIPTIFHNTYRLSAMTRSEAQSTITEPLDKTGHAVSAEDVFLNAVLDDLSAGGPQLYRSLTLGSTGPSTVDGVLPAQLQIICTHLYEGLMQGERRITLEAYEEAGRAAGILNRFLYRVLDALPQRDASIAVDVLKALVSSVGTRRVLSADGLAARVGVDRKTLHNVLISLVDARLLRQEVVAGEAFYELTHEYLVEELRPWFDLPDIAFKQAEEFIMRQLVSFRVYGTAVPQDQLILLYGYRERFVRLSEEAWEHLLRVVLQTEFPGEDWTKLASEMSERLLLVSLSDSRGDIRRAALKRLGAVWELPEVSQLADEDAAVRETALKALERLGDPRRVEPLIAALSDGDATVRQAAAESLGEIGDARAVEPLVVALHDQESAVRWRAVEALAKIGDARAVEPLIVALRDRDSAVRWSAAWALCEIGPPAVEPLTVALLDKDCTVRQSAARSLGKLGDARAVEPLIAALKEEDSTVRRLSAWALCQIGDPRAIQPLVAALRDEDKDVRWTALEALVNIRFT
jgi:HEAT repeat protein